MIASENAKFKGSGAWVEGDYVHLENLNECGRPVASGPIKANGLRKQFEYFIEYNKSKINCTVSLDATSRALRFSVKADWREIGERGVSTPVLRFEAPVSYDVKACRAELQFTTKDREQQIRHDSFSRRFYSALPVCGDRAVTLMTDTKYGYRCYDGKLSVNILRTTTGPNPHPEVGWRFVQIGLGVGSTEKEALYQMADEFVTEALYITNTAHPGTLPLSDSLVKASEGVGVSAVKVAEDDCGIVLRTFGTNEKCENATLTFAKEVKAAYLTDINEQTVADVAVDGSKVSYTIPYGKVRTVKVVF